MLTIDRLRLHLPAEYGNRAPLIARMVVDELALLPAKSDARIDRIRVAPITITPGTADRQIASQITAAVRIRLKGKRTRHPQV